MLNAKNGGGKEPRVRAVPHVRFLQIGVHPFLLRLHPQPPGLLEEQRRKAILGPQIHRRQTLSGEERRGEPVRPSETAAVHASPGGDGRREAQPPGGFWTRLEIPVAIGEKRPRLLPSVL